MKVLIECNGMSYRDENHEYHSVRLAWDDSGDEIIEFFKGLGIDVEISEE